MSLLRDFFGPEGPTLNDLADPALQARKLIASVRVFRNEVLAKLAQFGRNLV